MSQRRHGGGASSPERRQINIRMSEFDKDARPLMKALVEKINDTLFMWETFPIVLPEAVSVQWSHQDLFIRPQFSEDMRRVGTTSNGQRKHFNEQQLESVRQTGEFQAESEQFPGQFHHWILSRFLVKGKQKVQESYLCDLSKAAYLLATVARRCLFSSEFSLLQGINGLFRSVVILFDMIIGLPNLKAKDLEYKLQVERAKYLVAELKSSDPATLEALNDWVKTHEEAMKTPGQKLSNKPPVAIPYVFTTQNGAKINLSLCNKEIIRDAKPYLLQILTTSLQGWIPERRKEILAELIDAGHEDDDQVEEEIKSRIMVEYLDRVCHDVMTDSRLRHHGRNVPNLLIDQVKTFCVISEALEAEVKNLEIHIENVKAELLENNPVFSKLDSWMEDKLKEARADYISEHMWDAHTNAIKACEERGLSQSAYFLRRDLSFRRDREPRLKGELESVQEPAKTFTFETTIWFPHNWIIKEEIRPHEFEVIETMFTDDSGDDSMIQAVSRYRQSKYTITKSTVRTNTTKYPFWRWTNFVFATCSNFWNAVFLLGVVIPWCTRVSLRALFCVDPFFPEYEINPDNGKLRKSLDSRTLTLCYRVSAIWHHIRDDIEAFENAPDTGLLSKSFSRCIKYVINYIFKGLFGTLFLFFAMSISCLFVSIVSLVLAVTAPIHIPLLTLLWYLFMCFVCDFEGEFLSNGFLLNVVGNFLICGVGQTTISILVSCFFCPIGWMILTAFAITRKSLRNAWDAIVFQLIRKRVRIPLRDDFLTKRIAGPGLASLHYYQIKPQQALAMLQARMDREQLEYFKIETQRTIDEPQTTCREFIKKYLSPLGISLTNLSSGPLSDIERSCRAHSDRLDQMVSDRLKNCTPKLAGEVRSLIRLTEADLRLVLQSGSTMVESYYPENVFSRMSKKGMTSFWDNKGLVPDDWLGLCASHLCEVFSNDFVVPLQQTDSSFMLTTEHWNMERFTSMAYDTKWRDDLELSKIIRTPRTLVRKSSTSTKKSQSATIVEMPMSPARRNFMSQPKIPVEAFNPMSYAPPSESWKRHSCMERMLGNRWRIFKFADEFQHVSPKLVNPLPQIHPIEICILIYTRDSSTNANPINISFPDFISKIEERSSIVDDNDADRSEEDERSQAESSEQASRRDSGSVDQNPVHVDHEPYEDEDDDDDDEEDGRGRANKPTAASTPLLVNRKESLTYNTGKASPRSLNNESYSTIV